ncbi:MAG: YedE family putative selenium transporter [Planctomycetota bacterium]|nr:YedE family putative selenium transporter [Planctomycetota bacterium]
MRKESIVVILSGGIVGLLSVLLTVKIFGDNTNPPNMGFCIACFERDTAGALGLHRAEPVQYIRPEILGIIIGALIASLLLREFRSEGGSSPVLRFLLGMFVMFGALVFLGCPLRMVLRIAGGDLNGLIALCGFIAGVLVGVLLLKAGFNLGRAYPLKTINGWILPAIIIVLLILAITVPVFNPKASALPDGRTNSPIFSSIKGPGSQHAPLLFSLIAGIVVGVLAQRSRLCFAGGVRDTILIRDIHLLSGFIAVFAVAFFGNLIAGKVKFGFEGQPIAHTEHLWNFVGMALVGLGSVLLGGCPLRQLVLAGRGNTDSSLAVLGMVAGAAFAHNLNFASSPQGTTDWGRAIAITGIVVCVLIGLLNREKS